MTTDPVLPLLRAGDPFPPVDQAWRADSGAPGLVAAGGALDVATLRSAYAGTLFPWFSAGEPILWWSPDPRMVLQTERFRLHRSLRQALTRFRRRADTEIRVNTAFSTVIRACAQAPRPGQSGTWIVPAMQQAYLQLHQAGLAHSVETWIDGELVAGLYCVSIGRAVFGESMFTRVPDGSKLALAALVALCRRHGMPLIDCQQHTAHLAFMGASPMPRSEFAQRVRALVKVPAPAWRFEPLYWDALLPARTHHL